MTGNVFNWTLEIESCLEAVGKDIELKTLLRNQTMYAADNLPVGLKYKKFADNCTSPSRDYLNLTILNTTTMKVAVDIHFCLDQKGVVVYAVIHHNDVPNPIAFSMINNMTTTNQDYVKVKFENYLLEVGSLRRPMGRKVYSDFYYVQFNLSSITKKTMSLTRLTRKFFSDMSTDYSVKLQSYDDSKVNFSYIEWELVSSELNSYKTKLSQERWTLNLNTTNFSVVSFPVMQSDIKGDVYVSGSTMEILERFTTTIIDSDDRKYLWLMVEHSRMDSYIFRFSKDLIEANASNALKPDVWRVDNPMYGYMDNGFEIKSQKSDWVLASVKMIRDICYLIVYIVPDFIFVKKPQRINSIYSKQIATYEDVIDFTIEKSTDPTRIFI
jgi:hypothetical protein